MKILEVMPITPRYAIAFLKLDYINRLQPSIFAKNSFWDKNFKGLFVANHNVDIKQNQDLNIEFYILKKDKKIKDKTIEELNLKNFLISKYATNDDLYHYPIYELTTKEQVNLINAMLHSQTYKYVCYKKGKDLLKAIETIKLYGIYRIEDVN